MKNFKPIEFDGFKGYGFETFKTDNCYFNYPEFGVIETNVVEFDQFKNKSKT